MIILLSIVSHAISSSGKTDSININLTESIANNLTNEGFESVVVVFGENSALITYENRVYRDELNAATVISKLFLQDVKDKEKLVLVPQNRNIPIVAIVIPLDEYSAYIEGESSVEQFRSKVYVTIDVDSIWDKLNVRQRTARSYKKLELNFKSRVRGLFHSRERIASWNVDLAPELSFTFAKGTRLMMEGIFPLFYQFDQRNKKVQLGRVILNHTRRFTHNYWLSASVGAFDRDRYGISAESIKFWMNGKFYITARLDYTGYLRYTQGTWYYSKLNQLSYWGGLNYRFSKVDLLMRLGWGSYLIGDKAWKVDVLRSFGEFDLGFYGLWDNFLHPSEFLSGIYFRIPLPFFNSRIHNKIALRSQQYFYWGIQPHTDVAGRFIKSENFIEVYQKNLSPQYFKNNIIN